MVLLVTVRLPPLQIPPPPYAELPLRVLPVTVSWPSFPIPPASV
jgi:hypothetical protein